METTVNSIQMPVENSSITLSERAIFSERVLAAIVDNLILRIPLLLLTIFLWIPLSRSETDMLGRLVIGLLAIGVEFLVVISYFAGYSYFHNGQTLGKKLNVIKVTDLKGNNLSLIHFIGREFIARGIPIIGSLFVGYWANLWLLTYCLALTNNRRALHDIIAQTQVVRV